MAERYHTTISEEPSTGAVRGKLPATLVRALDAGAGDVIEYVVKGDRFTGRVMSSKEARSYKEESGRGGGSSKPKAKAKATSTKAKAKAKPKKKGRKTEVEYDTRPKKKGKKKVVKITKISKKKGKKGRR